MSQRGTASSVELKSMGLKATLPRMKILEIFQRSSAAQGIRHLSAEDVYKALLAEKAFRVRYDETKPEMRQAFGLK